MRWKLIFLVCAAVAMIALAALPQTETPPTIQWTWEGRQLMHFYSNSRTLQFGLRSDGIVVWRELVSSTNSPAENVGPARRGRMAPQILPPPPPTNQPGPLNPP